MEPKKTGKFGKGNPGKPKGAITKVKRTALEVIQFAAEKLGGADRIVEWAQESPKNEAIFWGTVYPKLLPLQVTGNGGGAIVLQLLSSDADL